MLAEERLGSAAGALAAAATILEESDLVKGGTTSRWQHSLAHACRGRALASRGEPAAAEAAFDAAVVAAEAHGTRLFGALAVRDLTAHVLDGAGRGAEGRHRLEKCVAPLACGVEDLGRALPRPPPPVRSFTVT
jgi:hypothetical protein